MKRFANITVIGRDKTGVVARITHFLFENNANIEALEEQVTRGQFSMNILASWSGARFQETALAKGFNALAADLKMEIRFRVTDPRRPQRCAILVTREAHCLEEILKQHRQRKLRMEPALVLGNRKDLEPVARQAGLPFHFISWTDRNRAEVKALSILEKADVDFVVLARFMKILSPNFVWRYKNKIINIHPSLLPSFPGPQAYRQAYEHGVKIAGVTAHFVSMQLDEGPIIAQGSYEIRSDMSLKQIVEKGQSEEARVLVKAIRLYLTNRLDVHWGTVREA